jgi:uncharacterized protein (TIRG00374 family)
VNLRVRAAVGLAISVGLIAFLLWEANPKAVLEAIAKVRPLLLLPALIPVAIDLSIRTFRWRFLMARAPRPSYRDTFRYLTIGDLANIVIPARLGEVVRARLIGTRAAVGPSRALGSIAMERALDVVCAAGIGALAARALEMPSGFVTVLALLALGGFAVLIALVVTPRGISRRFVDGLVDLGGRGRVARLAHAAGRFAHALLDTCDPPRMVVALAASVVTWFVSATVFGIAAWSLGMSVAPLVLLTMMLTANLGAALPSAPAGIGTYEFGVVFVGHFAGLDTSSALALGIVAHLTTVLPVALVGAIELSQIDWDLSRLRRVAESATGTT